MTSVLTDIRTKDDPVTNEPSQDFAGYFTIKCGVIGKCLGCGHRLEFVEVDGPHVIVVWENKDDEWILHVANSMQQEGLKPKIVNYEVNFGPAEEFYQAVKSGHISGVKL